MQIENMIKKVKSIIFRIKSKFKSKYKRLQNTIEILQNKIDSLQNNVESLRNNLDFLQNNVEEVNAKTIYLSDKIDLINSNINVKAFSGVKNALNTTEKQDYRKTAVLFKYDYYTGVAFLGFQGENHFGVNLGDYVQTLATKNVIKTISPDTDFVFWDRDNLLHYHGKKAYSIMQGWFSHGDAYLPNENILPIFLGTHITTEKRNTFINFIKHNPGYFENVTFGCRDTSTLEFFKSIGLKSYLSRCLTLTFPKRPKLTTQNKVFIVNIPDEYLKFIPSDLVNNAEFINQRSVDTSRNFEFYVNSAEKYVTMTEQVLDNYRNNASLVITSALHCASPCIAMGIPTVLIDFEDNNDRFGSLKGIFNIYNKSDLADGKINFNPETIDLEELKHLMMKNVELSVKQAFDEDIDIDELRTIREEIENYKVEGIDE